MKGSPCDPRWRWNGSDWEHSHGQEGHYPARHFDGADLTTRAEKAEADLAAAQARIAELEADSARLREALERNIQGCENLLSYRRCVDGRYYLDRDEIETELELSRTAIARAKEQP